MSTDKAKSAKPHPSDYLTGYAYTGNHATTPEYVPAEVRTIARAIYAGEAKTLSALLDRLSDSSLLSRRFYVSGFDEKMTLLHCAVRMSPHISTYPDVINLLIRAGASSTDRMDRTSFFIYPNNTIQQPVFDCDCLDIVLLKLDNYRGNKVSQTNLRRAMNIIMANRYHSQPKSRWWHALNWCGKKQTSVTKKGSDTDSDTLTSV